MMERIIDTPYIRYTDRITDRGRKLVCISYGGGGASYYLGWQKQFGGEVEIMPVQLPGHENRIAEPLFVDARMAADAIADAVGPYLADCEFAVFGHSVGGLLAFETAVCLESRGMKPAFCAISSARIIEGEDPPFTLSSELSDDDFLQRVFAYGALDENSPILQYPEFQEVFIKILRADFNMEETLRARGEKLQCPVVAMYGNQEKLLDAQKMKSWEKYTEGQFLCTSYEGDHFYINDHLAEIVQLLQEMFAKAGESA